MPRLVWERKKKIHVVSNENAGKNTGARREREVIIAMLEHAYPQTMYSKADLRVFRTHDLHELDEAKSIMLKECPDIIAFFGGDGTIQRALGEEDNFLEDILVGDVRPIFLFFGGGSTDVIKGDLKVLGRDSVRATERIIEKIRRGIPLDIIHRHYLNINGKKGFVYGSGITAELLEKYNAKSPKGARRLMKVVAWMLFNETFKFLPPWRRRSVAEKIPVAHQFWSDDKLVLCGDGKRSGVIASTLGQVGMGCKITSRSLEHVAHFHCIVSGLGFWHTVANLPAMFSGTSLIGDVVDEIATKVVLEYGSPVLHMIDGEIYGSDEMTNTVVIEQGPVLDIVRS